MCVTTNIAMFNVLRSLDWFLQPLTTCISTSSIYSVKLSSTLKPKNA